MRYIRKFNETIKSNEFISIIPTEEMINNVVGFLRSEGFVTLEEQIDTIKSSKEYLEGIINYYNDDMDNYEIKIDDTEYVDWVRKNKIFPVFSNFFTIDYYDDNISQNDIAVSIGRSSKDDDFDKMYDIFNNFYDSIKLDFNTVDNDDGSQSNYTILLNLIDTSDIRYYTIHKNCIFVKCGGYFIKKDSPASLGYVSELSNRLNKNRIPGYFTTFTYDMNSIRIEFMKKG